VARSGAACVIVAWAADPWPWTIAAEGDAQSAIASIATISPIRLSPGIARRPDNFSDPLDLQPFSHAGQAAPVIRLA
jgi:hypothetical protein